MPEILVDAGPLVALLHKDDKDRGSCVDILKRLREPLLTTWMPVTEAMSLLGFSVDAQSGLLKMIERGMLKVLTLGVDNLPGIRKLIRQYADLPMPRWCRLRNDKASIRFSHWTDMISPYTG